MKNDYFLRSHFFLTHPVYLYNIHNIYNATYQVAALPRGARIEIEAVAIVGDIVNVE